MLKDCPDCQKQYSKRAQHCLHCGAPNDDLNVIETAQANSEESTNWGFIIVMLIVTFLMFFYGKETRDYVLNLFNVGIVAAVDLEDCDSDRIKNEIKSTFDQSQYALAAHLKAVMVTTENTQTKNGAVLSCVAQITLNNSQILHYDFNFKKHGDDYLVEGKARY